MGGKARLLSVAFTSHGPHEICVLCRRPYSGGVPRECAFRTVMRSVDLSKKCVLELSCVRVQIAT